MPKTRRCRHDKNFLQVVFPKSTRCRDENAHKKSENDQKHWQQDFFHIRDDGL
jgi:hypothetical protein